VHAAEQERRVEAANPEELRRHDAADGTVAWRRAAVLTDGSKAVKPAFTQVAIDAARRHRSIHDDAT